ncbi:hypothetical protein L1987_28876 [Smallanthus sonchifolius]|uniref:Uncharacterized protein n=1 Tax=Smallanthus sonchifolius TaxID=185202 RepID=A0ACB9I082_9ASTR|nr:hypothetical protein L1987_28876 [Smallanthus sonchifolius]
MTVQAALVAYMAIVVAVLVEKEGVIVKQKATARLMGYTSSNRFVARASRSMGIQGLLPLLKSIMVPIHIKDLEGCSVAVDTYSWLHKGALSCSKELCKSEPTSKHVNYCMHRVNLLRHYGVKPILVFDGGHLPMKNEQEIKRARSRKENLARAIEHESCGNASAAYECYQKAVDISPAIAYELIQVLKKENIPYIVAPYEADAQMTFLAISKHVDAVITEDSDLIPFGCPRIIYKMDKYGQGVEFQYSKLPNNKELNLTGFTKQMILEMCILSGCDYLQSLPGMGLKKAHALIKKLKSYDKGECVKERPQLDGTYNLKSFKPEGANKKLDLPAQKNLVTNYFCFASLEAKREFKAPRVSPKQPNPTNEIPQIDLSEEIVDTIVSRKTSLLMESDSHDDMRRAQHSKHTIHPCIASQKESEPNSSLDASEGKTRVQKKPVVVRSRYFQHKSSEDITEVNIASKNTPSSGDPVSVSGPVEVKASIENMKLNKSRYFTHENQENTNERQLETNNSEVLTMKRKFSFVDDSVKKENLNKKCMWADQTPANQGVCNSDLDDQMQATRDEEEKFGCNISHLGKYSEIAEKSMEKFISVISSFACASSGSRASGLRAPLKDVRNTFTKKSSPIDEISKFAYTPSKPLPSRRS